jgi:hypothetical protein
MTVRVVIDTNIWIRILLKGRLTDKSSLSTDRTRSESGNFRYADGRFSIDRYVCPTLIFSLI